MLTLLTGAEPPPLEQLLAARGGAPPGGRARRPGGRAASLSAPALGRVSGVTPVRRPARRGQPGLPRGARAAARAARRCRRRRLGRGRHRGGSGGARARARRGADRLPAARARRRARRRGRCGRRCPTIAVVCLTASASLRERDALLEAGVVVCLSKDEELDEIVAAIHRAAGSVAGVKLLAGQHRDRARLDRRLPGGAGAVPNWRDRPALRPLRPGDLQGLRRALARASSTRSCARRQTLPTTSQPTPGDFLACYEELAGLRAHLLAPLSGTLSGTVESARTAAGMLDGDKVRVVDTEIGLGRGGDARARDPAAARGGDDRRGGRGAGRPLPARARG